MSDCNATDNYSPNGASSLRTLMRGNQKRFYVKRAIDINSSILLHLKFKTLQIYYFPLSKIPLKISMY